MQNWSPVILELYLWFFFVVVLGDYPKGTCTWACRAGSRLTSPNIMTAVHQGSFCTHTKLFTRNKLKTFSLNNNLQLKDTFIDYDFFL